MTVIFYDEGDHPAGFIGFRVATTIGVVTDYKQDYFALSQYDYRTAKLKAILLNRKWRKEAEEVKRNGKPRGWFRTAPNLIANGFRASIIVSSKTRSSSKSTTFEAVYLIAHPDNPRKFTRVNTRNYDYVGGYQTAVDAYVELYNPTAEEESKLRSNVLDPTVFTEYLFGRTISNGHRILLKDVTDSLNL